MTIDRDPAEDWYVRLPPRQPAPLRLLAFANAGSGPGSFGRFARAISETAEVWAARLPGRQARFREPSRTEFAPLVKELADAVPTVVEDQPYALLGYCSGALLAYGVMHELQRRGHRLPENLVVISYAPPHRVVYLPNPSQLPSEEFWAEVTSFGGFPPTLDQAQHRRTFESALRADFAVIGDFREEEFEDLPEPSVPITVIAGHGDAYMDTRDLAGWSRYGADEFALRRIPGGHWLLEERLDAVTRIVRRELT